MGPDASDKPGLLLGPVLRYVGEHEATVWVEAEAECEVEVLGRTERTFCIEGHHYAIVSIDGLEPASSTEYEVHLDGDRAWPPADSEFPPSRITTLDPSGEMRIAFGSCRVALPHHPPYTLSRDEHELGAECDALDVLAQQLLRGAGTWPSLLLMLGDQVYVDEGSPRTREFIRARRDISEPPGEQVLDFEEYHRLYLESWGDPAIRWLFSTVPCAMVIDDHDMSDDWNISAAWVEDMEQTSWWRDRLVAGLMSYWLYQYIGNLSPAELAEDETLSEVRAAGDGTETLRRFAAGAYEEMEGMRWSYHRDLGNTRLLVLDSRIGRVLDEGNRRMIDREEMDWVWEQTRGDFDHLLIATSDPFLLTPGIHYLEAWSEAVCDGVWGGAAARVGEKIRRALDLDHWPAFGDSFEEMSQLLRSVGAGERGDAPASIVLLSGDVHHAYLAEVAFPADADVSSAVVQAVCSPFRNPLEERERKVIRWGLKDAPVAGMRALARAAGVGDPPIRWRFAEGPFFDNQVATLSLNGRSAKLKLEKTEPGEADERKLETVFRRRLA